MKRVLLFLLFSVPLSAQSTTPNLGMTWPPHGAANWDTNVVANSVIVDSVFGIPNCALIGWNPSTKILTCPTNVSISGTQLINQGTEQVGPAISSFDANIQSQAFDPASGTVAISGQNKNASNTSGFSAGVQGIAQGFSALAFWGLASNTVSTTTDFPNAGDFQAFLTCTGNCAGGPIGSDGAGIGSPAVATTMATATGLQGQANNLGAGIITTMAAVRAANGINTGGGTVTNNYGFDSPVQAVGTTNAVYHAADQGSGANNYGILLAGVTHNDLGSGVTKVGGLLVSGLSANLPTCTDGSKNLSTSGCAAATGATVYYVSNSGSDAANGTTTGTPWQTVAKVNAVTFNPGDSVLFKRDGTWREFMVFPSAGVFGKTITIGAYDVGKAPRITAADVLTAGGFSVFSGANYQHALTTDPGSWVTENAVPLTKVGSTAAVTAGAGTFFWAANVVYVHATDGSNPSSSGKVYESGIRFAAIAAKSYNTIDGLQLDFGTFVVNADQANGLTIRNSSLKFGNSNDIWVSDSPKTNNQAFDNDEFAYSPTGIYCHGDNFYVRNSNLHNLTRSIELRDITAQHCKNFQINYNVFSNDGGASEVNAGVLLDGDTNSSNTDYHQGVIQGNQFNNMQSRPIDGFFGDSFILGNTINYTSAGSGASDVSIEINGPGNTACGNTINNTSNIGMMVNVDPIAADRATTLCDNKILQTAGTLNHVIYIVTGSPQPIFSNNQYWPGSPQQTKYFWHGTDYTFANWVIQSGDSTSAEFPQATQNQVFFCGTTATCAKTVQTTSIHVWGTVPLVSASPSTASLTALPYTSSSSYACRVSPVGTTAAIAAGGVAVNPTSGSAITFTGPNTVTTVISFDCDGT